jgi:hypothetical protein
MKSIHVFRLTVGALFVVAAHIANRIITVQRPTLYDIWSQLNILPLLLSFIAEGGRLDRPVNRPVVYLAFNIQWFIIGWVIAFAVSRFFPKRWREK